MDVFDITDLDLSPEETKGLNETISEGFFKNPEIKEFHQVQEGIKNDRKITILKTLTGLAGAVQVGCVPAANETQGGATNKLWATKYIEDRWSQCWKDLRSTFWRYALKPGTDKPDLNSTEFASYLDAQLRPYIREILLRIAYFGDTAIAAGTNNNLGAGQLRYFNMIDGFWKQIATGIAGGLIPQIAIARNAQASFANQRFDATDRINQVVTESFEQAYINADSRLTDEDRSNLVYVVTKSMADQYWLERTKASGIPLAYERTESGMDKLQFNGIDVIPFNFQDRIIRSYFGDDATPVKYINPHRGIFTTKDNLLLGTESNGTMEDLKPFYAEKEKDYNVDWGTDLDAKLGLEYKTVAIY